MHLSRWSVLVWSKNVSTAHAIAQDYGKTVISTGFQTKILTFGLGYYVFFSSIFECLNLDKGYVRSRSY